MSVAFVFPGQGSQVVGMGKALAEAFPESRAVFDEADAALGAALSRLCFDGPEAELQLTANTQPAILASSVAALRPLVARGARPDWVAGHSLGEYSALVAAGAIGFADAVRTVRRRGEYMQEAVPNGVGAMAAILGLDLPAVEEACREAAAGEVVSPANVNSPGQVVIAGHAAAVERASRAVPVAGRPADGQAARLRAVPLLADEARPGPPRRRARGDRVPRPRDPPRQQRGRPGRPRRRGLPGGARAPGRRRRAVAGVGRAPRARGRHTFVEVGPGTVLCGLVRKIARGTRVLSVDSPESLEAALAALRAEA